MKVFIDFKATDSVSKGIRATCIKGFAHGHDLSQDMESGTFTIFTCSVLLY